MSNSFLLTRARCYGTGASACPEYDWYEVAIEILRSRSYGVIGKRERRREFSRRTAVGSKHKPVRDGQNALAATPRPEKR